MYFTALIHRATFQINNMKLNHDYPEIPDSWHLFGAYASSLDKLGKELKHIVNSSEDKLVISTAELLISISSRAQTIALNIFSHYEVRRCGNKRCCEPWYKNLQDTKSLFQTYAKDLERM